MLEQEYERIRSDIQERGATVVVGEVLNAAGEAAQAIAAIAHATNATNDVVGGRENNQFHYTDGEAIEALGHGTSWAVVAVFGLGIAADALSLGFSGGSGTMTAASIAGAISVPSTVAKSIHEYKTKYPELANFALLVRGKCRFKTKMNDTNMRLREEGYDPKPEPDSDEESDHEGRGKKLPGGDNQEERKY
jgi:hypothetical protein